MEMLCYLKDLHPIIGLITLDNDTGITPCTSESVFNVSSDGNNLGPDPDEHDSSSESVSFKEELIHSST